MPIPEQAIEKLTRAPEQPRGAYGELLMFAATLLFISVGVWVGITFGYKPYLENQVTKLDAEIKTYSDRIPLAKQQELIAFYSQLVNVKKLLANHVVSSPLFDWLEHLTQANVAFTKANVNTLNQQLSVTGVAKSVEDIAEQIALFEHDPNVSSVNFNNLGSPTAPGLWQFTATVVFKKSFFSAGTPAPLP